MIDKQTEANLLERLRSLPPELIAGFPVSLEASRLVGRFFKCSLHSEFQPVFFDTSQAMLANLAVRGPNGAALHEDKLFALATGEEGLLRLDRLVRLLHALNHFVVHGCQAPVVMHVHSLMFAYVREGHGKPFATLLRHFELDPKRVVLILPDEIVNTAEGVCILSAYKAQGFGVCAAQTVGWDGAVATNGKPWIWDSETQISGLRWDSEASFQRL